MEIFHPPLIPPIKGGKVPSPLVGEGQGEGCFRINTINTATWGKKGNWNSNQT